MLQVLILPCFEIDQPPIKPSNNPWAEELSLQNKMLNQTKYPVASLQSENLQNH